MPLILKDFKLNFAEEDVSLQTIIYALAYNSYNFNCQKKKEGKTDYYARKRLIHQDNDKYNTPKYRLIARITNSKVICQIAYATILGDTIICQASSTELKKWGLNAGLTNYASAYATGLLCARRLLAKLKMDKYYPTQKASGDYFLSSVKPNPERKPFACVLDVGLTRTTTGNKVFGCMKGATDGGLNIPHKTTRFPGSKLEGEKVSYNASIHRERIFGVHVDKYMKLIQKKDPQYYAKKFRIWIDTLKKAGVDSCEKLYTKIHEEIKKNPNFEKKKEKVNPPRAHSKYRQKRLKDGLNNQRRRERVAKKIAIAQKNQAS